MKEPEKQCRLNAELSLRLNTKGDPCIDGVSINCGSCDYFVQFSALDELGIEDAEGMVRDEILKQGELCKLFVQERPGIIKRLFGVRSG